MVMMLMLFSCNLVMLDYYFITRQLKMRKQAKKTKLLDLFLQMIGIYRRIFGRFILNHISLFFEGFL